MKYWIFTVCTLAILFSCTEKPVTEDNHLNNYSIVLGHICGWCAGADSLHITGTQLTYTDIGYCSDSISIQHKPYSFNELNSLLDLIDLEDFRKVSINTCNVCVDGCDTWVSVCNDTLSHTIRFGFRDSVVIEPVKDFVDALHDIQAGFIKIDSK